ncbi:hypothetical protein SEUCBS139899_003434 [Sporothrix eucalyptigena]|uniref:Uncharacterized protein n=1 Tax=Sporothrix eucalyptigena TaxID=1812306 RepID=A0ABP0C6V5_9PEZI
MDTIPAFIWRNLPQLLAIADVGTGIVKAMQPNATAAELTNARGEVLNWFALQARLGQAQYEASVRAVCAQLGIQEAVLLQVLATQLQTQEQAGGMADITRVLQGLATDLRTYARPDLVGQILSVGSFLIGADAAAHIRRLAVQAERMATSLERIGDNVYSQNARGDGFPGHVHAFVRSMDEAHSGNRSADVGLATNQPKDKTETKEPTSHTTPHYFVVFNQSTTWHPEFDKINRATPLGDHFLGYSHDLDELVAFLVNVARPRLGPEPVLHILMPTIGQVAIKESLTFPDALGPFRVTGQLGESGIPMVYVCMPRRIDQQNLRHVGLLRPPPRWVLLQHIGLPLPFLHEWLFTTLEPVYFDDPYYAIPTFGSMPFYGNAYVPAEPIPPRVLGQSRGP